MTSEINNIESARVVIFHNYYEAFEFQKASSDKPMAERITSIMITIYQKIIAFYAEKSPREWESFRQKNLNVSFFEQGYKIIQLVDEDQELDEKFTDQFTSIQAMFENELVKYQKSQEEQKEDVGFI